MNIMGTLHLAEKLVSSVKERRTALDGMNNECKVSNIKHETHTKIKSQRCSPTCMDFPVEFSEEDIRSERNDFFNEEVTPRILRQREPYAKL